MIINHSSRHMSELEDKSIQCIITSPPYPMIQKWDKCFTEQGVVSFEDIHETLFKDILAECHRVLIPGGIMSINIGDATRTINKNFVCYPNYAFIIYNCMQIGFNPLVPIIWKKISNRPNAFLGSGFLPVNAYVSQDCEFIAIFKKGEKREFKADEKLRRELSKFSKDQRDVWYSQIWTIRGERGAGKTSAWPIEIFYRLMRMYSIIGDTILDPFCDGGIDEEQLCKNWGRAYIGYTINN